MGLLLNSESWEDSTVLRSSIRWAFRACHFSFPQRHTAKSTATTKQHQNGEQQGKGLRRWRHNNDASCCSCISEYVMDRSPKCTGIKFKKGYKHIKNRGRHSTPSRKSARLSICLHYLPVTHAARWFVIRQDGC